MNKNLGYSIPSADLSLDLCSFFIKYQYELQKAFGWIYTTENTYENYIYQLRPFLKNIPLTESSDTIFSQAIDEMNGQKKKPYSKNTIKVFYSIINDVYYFAETYSADKFINVLWGTSLDKNPDAKKEIVNSVEQQIEQKMALPRSLSLSEEIKLIDIVKGTYLTNSFSLGLAIMFYMGLRPGECCGLTYGCIRPLLGYPDVNCLYIYNQIRDKKDLTNSLKTENSYRILPIPDELNEMIQKRKAFISKRISNLSNRPIVCHDEGSGLSTVCNPTLFANYCKNRLREVSVKEDVMLAMAKEASAEGRGEAAATSYLLRRNFATALLSICSMEDDEIKFLMGHAIYTLDESRRDYLNPDVIYRIWQKLNRRRYFSKQEHWYTISESALSVHQKSAILTVNSDYLKTHPEGVILHVQNTDISDRVNIKVMEGQPSSVQLFASIQPVEQKKAARVRVHEEVSEAITKTRNSIGPRKK